ncbi:opioid growth factor receptor-like protein 1 [Ictalurus punctatus]|uniref:Opioid growth factor receptor-like protein 1 n=1 Tax=Ictalurus punctatus TaxID=7998 RepID=A0A2D0TBD0_ICTPU|nr:opioid growth factor receptor-like protein 1 [Ictalurus punctatus]
MFYSDCKMGCEGSVMEDPDNEYDSTWDDEYGDQKLSMMRVTKHRTRTTQRNLVAARDMQMFRHRCEKNRPVYQHGQESRLPNLDFYQNKTPSRPDGVYIEDFHKHWFGDYTKLEKVHSYIQWLFPTQEPGVNYCAHVLTPTEIMHFHKDNTVKKRLLKSYKLMLDFYGIKLVCETTGKVQYAGNWKERFENLNRNTHNNLRITRILKCLGLLGFRHYQAPLVDFFLKETLVHGNLPQVKQSVMDYFIFTVLDKSERKQLIKFAFCHFEPKEQFVWCPIRIQRMLLKRITPIMNQHPYSKPRVKVAHSGSQNSSRNSKVPNAGQSKIDPRNAHRSAQNYNGNNRVQSHRTRT